MKSENFRRGNQRTFIELIVIYLSCIVLRPRKNHDPQSIVPYRLCRPIANNQTHFVEIGIHEMIIGLLKNKFRQDNEGDDQSQALCEILSLLHGPYSIQVRDSIAAPRWTWSITPIFLSIETFIPLATSAIAWLRL